MTTTEIAALSNAEAVALAVKLAAGTHHEQNAREHAWALEESLAYDRDATNCFLAQLVAKPIDDRRVLTPWTDADYEFGDEGQG